MTTTPEQLQAWREEFEKPLKLLPNYLKRLPQRRDEYANDEAECEWQGYLRRCQETEQAIKDAHKQALEEALKLAEDRRLDLDGSEYWRGWRNASIHFAKQIKGLLA